MKRVLIFSLAYYPHVGGAEVAIKEITDRITDIEFHMVTLRFSENDVREEKIGKVWVHRIGNGKGKFDKFLFQGNAARKAYALHRVQPFDAAWAMMAHSAGVPTVLFNLRYPKVPYVLSLQEGDPIPQIERTMLPLWPLFTRAFTRATLILPLSHYLARWARARQYKGPIEIVPNGVSVTEFSGVPIAHVGKVLITTSRLVRKNAVDEVIKALALLPESVRFQILGSGPEHAALRTLAHSYGVESRVEFLGHIDRSAMPAYLHSADIFIRPSRTEGFGISFIEAMAAELPVIATQEGGIADFLFDAKRNPDKPPTGWAVDTDSPEQIAEAVKDILANPEQVKKVLATAKAMVSEKYDWDLIAKNMREKVFARLLGDFAYRKPY
jgi:glycosyltransferase involved in cell wall biosynthesis